MAVGTLEEIIDENHAIVSTSVGSEYYVVIMTFVDKDLLEPGCTVLLNHKVCVRVSVSVCVSLLPSEYVNVCHYYLLTMLRSVLLSVLRCMAFVTEY